MRELGPNDPDNSRDPKDAFQEAADSLTHEDMPMHEPDAIKFHVPPKYHCEKHGDQGSKSMSFTWYDNEGGLERSHVYCFECYHEQVKEHCFELTEIKDDSIS